MKKIAIKICLAFFLIILIFSMSFYFRKDSKMIDENILSKKNINGLSMMIETSAGSGDYEKTTLSSWPTDGYIFNATLSKCENGGKLSWDDDKKKVIFAGNTFDKCYVYFDKYTLIIITDYSVTASGTSINIVVTAKTGTGSIAKYYYSKDNGETYVESTSNMYSFTGLSDGLYNVKAYVEDSNGKRSGIISKSIDISTPASIAQICNDGTNLSICIINYASSGFDVSSIYHHDGTLENGINDGSYRYSGASPSNYICLGSTKTTCPDANLFRIIGVFYNQVDKVNQVKVIRANSVGNIKWSRTAANVWSSSSLNTYLNADYYNTLNSTLKKRIATMTWIVGGNTYVKIRNALPSKAYQNEIVSPAKDSTTSSEIGLMYVSDYMYAASQDKWTLVGYNSADATKDYRAAISTNWLYLGDNEWTITKATDGSNSSYYVHSSGHLEDNLVAQFSHAVRPVFYLDSSVTYKSGSGSSADDPIRIN